MMEDCKHSTFRSGVKMRWVRAEGLGFAQLIMIVKVSCAACGKPYTFRSPVGFSTEEASTNFSGEELRVPIDQPFFRDEEDEEDGPTIH